MNNTNTYELDLTYVKLCNRKAELYKRNKRAEQYSANAARRMRKGNRLAKFFRRNAEQIITATLLIATVCMLGYGILTKEPSESRYAIAGEDSGLHYIYVTERICTVTEIVQDYVTVEYNGEEYSFFGYGYEVGEEIICQFTDGWEIVGVVE